MGGGDDIITELTINGIQRRLDTFSAHVTRAVTIYQYVAILQYDVSQYNSIHLLRHINILRRAIYCSVLRVLCHKCAQRKAV